MVDGGRPLEVLDSILEQYRVVRHGVAMYFGSADKFDTTHLQRFKRLVKRTKTPWLSDHLCWGSVDGRYTRVKFQRQAMRNYGYRLVSTPGLVAGYGAEQPVRLAVDPVGEVEDIGTAVVAAHPELDRPQAARG